MENYNDERKKSFFCVAANLLELQDVKSVLEQIETESDSHTKSKSEMTGVIIGAEPTAEYWFTFAEYLKVNYMRFVFVSPIHVKRTKELDDNHPSKTDNKDPKTIAKLVVEGRYMEPYIPEDIYAELRVMNNSRQRVTKELNATRIRINRWLTKYFPKYKKVFADWRCESSLILLQNAPLPSDMLKLDAENINQLWRAKKLRAVGMKRAKSVVEMAQISVGVKQGANAARMEIQMLAGYAIYETSSSKHKGKSGISKRGRKRLRHALFQVIMPMIRSNKEFRELHQYYTTRAKNALKGKQSVVALACKLIRVFWAILTKGVSYNSDKLVSDIISEQIGV